jgi:NADH dehydrogenase FAD-containing subunit
LFHEKQIAIIGGGAAAFLLAAFLDPQKNYYNL